MKTIKISLIALACFCFTNADAQLLSKVSKVANTVNTANNAVNAGEKISKKMKGKGKGGESAGLKLDWTTFKQTPAITFNSLLYGTSNGRFDNYTATFVPHKTASGKEVDPIYDQAEYLKIKVYKDNQYINYFEYEGDQIFDDGKKTKFNSPKDRYKRDGEFVGWADMDWKQWGPGNYRLDFYAGDKMFYSFDFELHKLTNPDTYSNIGEMYVTRGPWNNYAFMQHADTGNLLFGFYLDHEEFQPDKSNNRKTTKSVKWSVKMLKDGKPYAQQYGTGPNVAQVRQAEWQEYNCAFKLIDKPGELKYANMTDGAYKLEVTIEGEAKPRVYTFDVKNKAIVQIPEQDRAKNADPTRLIEGWNDFFWMKLEK